MNSFKIHFLNVGDGDCTIIELPDGNIMMVDIQNGYNYKHLFGQISKEENPILYLNNISNISEIYRYIQTHPEMDHMGGLKELKENFKILHFWDTANKRPKPDFSSPYAIGREEDWDAYQELRRNSIKFYRGDIIDKNNQHVIYPYKIYVLHPTQQITNEVNSSQGKWNNLSYVFILEYKGFKLLYCGDPETSVWKDIYEWIISNNKEDWLRNITVFKVSHHGRKSGYCGSEILNLAKPQYIVISKGSVDPKDYAYSYYYNFLGDGNKIFITSQGTVLVDYYDEINRYFRINYV